MAQARAGRPGGRRLGEEAVDGHLEREAMQRRAAGAQDGLADRPHPQGRRTAGVVEAVEEAAGERGIALQHGDEVR